jgi:hypothetical protein
MGARMHTRLLAFACSVAAVAVGSVACNGATRGPPAGATPVAPDSTPPALIAWTPVARNRLALEFSRPVRVASLEVRLDGAAVAATLEGDGSSTPVAVLWLPPTAGLPALSPATHRLTVAAVVVDGVGNEAVVGPLPAEMVNEPALPILGDAAMRIMPNGAPVVGQFLDASDYSPDRVVPWLWLEERWAALQAQAVAQDGGRGFAVEPGGAIDFAVLGPGLGTTVVRLQHSSWQPEETPAATKPPENVHGTPVLASGSNGTLWLAFAQLVLGPSAYEPRGVRLLSRKTATWQDEGALINGDRCLSGLSLSIGPGDEPLIAFQDVSCDDARTPGAYRVERFERGGLTAVGAPLEPDGSESQPLRLGSGQGTLFASTRERLFRLDGDLWVDVPGPPQPWERIAALAVTPDGAPVLVLERAGHRGVLVPEETSLSVRVLRNGSWFPVAGFDDLAAPGVTGRVVGFEVDQSSRPVLMLRVPDGTVVRRGDRA